MKVDIDIKNFGKINNAHIKVRPFTVIAGVNSSGKSFISRALYSFFNTVNRDHYFIELNRLVNEFDSALEFCDFTLKKSKPPVFLENEHFKLNIFNQRIKDVLASYSGESIIEQTYVSRNIMSFIYDINNVINNLISEVENKKKYDNYNDSLNYIKFKSRQLLRAVGNHNSVAPNNLAIQMKDSLIENFQVRGLDELLNKEIDYLNKENDYLNKENDYLNTYFKISNLGIIRFGDDVLNCEINPSGMNEYRDLKNVAFIESPMYWKLKPVLEARRNRIRYNSHANINKNELLTGVPQHFFDLVDLLDEKSKTSDHDLPIDCFLDINNQLNGEIDISDSGDIVFHDYQTDKEFGLYSTATGIVSIGIVSLLIKKGVINKGSFLFIDEPESNLHPAWQGLMIQTLHKLSQCGVNVVITTHSIDMIQTIENIIDDNSNDDNSNDDHYAINILNDKGYSINNDSPLYKKLSIIKEQLGTPFFNSYMNNIW